MDDDALFNEKNEVKPEYNTLAWGKIGDWFKGTLTDDTRTMKSKFPPYEVQTVFEFKAHGGSFHDIVNKVVQEKPTEVKAGEFWSHIVGKPALLAQLKKAKLGQIIGFRFTELKESKTPGFDAAKIIKVYLGGMDPEYQGEGAND